MFVCSLKKSLHGKNKMKNLIFSLNQWRKWKSFINDVSTAVGNDKNSSLKKNLATKDDPSIKELPTVFSSPITGTSEPSPPLDVIAPSFSTSINKTLAQTDNFGPIKELLGPNPISNNVIRQ